MTALSSAIYQESRYFRINLKSRPKKEEIHGWSMGGYQPSMFMHASFIVGAFVIVLTGWLLCMHAKPGGWRIILGCSGGGALHEQS